MDMHACHARRESLEPVQVGGETEVLAHACVPGVVPAAEGWIGEPAKCLREFQFRRDRFPGREVLQCQPNASFLEGGEESIQGAVQLFDVFRGALFPPANRLEPGAVVGRGVGTLVLPQGEQAECLSPHRDVARVNDHASCAQLGREVRGTDGVADGCRLLGGIQADEREQFGMSERHAHRDGGVVVHAVDMYRSFSTLAGDPLDEIDGEIVPDLDVVQAEIQDLADQFVAGTVQARVPAR